MHDQAMGTEGPAATLVAELESWLPDALRVAVSRLGNRADAEDSVQDACRDALTAVRRMPRSGGIRKGWFITIVVNRCRMLLRSRRRRSHHEARVEIPGAAVADAGHRTELSDLVASALVELPERERRPIELRFLGGLDFREIAEVLGRPEPTLRSQVDRGLERLRAILSRQGTTTTPTSCAVALAAIPPITASGAWTPAGLAAGAGAAAPAATSTITVVGILAAAAVLAALLTPLLRGPGTAPPAASPAAAVPQVVGTTDGDEDPPAIADPVVRLVGTGPFQSTSMLRALAISPDHQRIAWAGYDAYGWWDLATGSGPSFPQAGTRDVAWADDGHLLLLTAERDPRLPNRLSLHTLAGGAERSLNLPPMTDAYRMALAADRSLVALPCGFPAGGAPSSHPGPDDGSEAILHQNLAVALIELPTLRILERIGPLPDPDSGQRVTEIAFSPDATRLAVITNSNGGSGKGPTRGLRVWDRGESRLIADLKLPYVGLVSELVWSDPETLRFRHYDTEPPETLTGTYHLKDATVETSTGWTWMIGDAGPAELRESALILRNGTMVPMPGMIGARVVEDDGVLAIGEGQSARVFDLETSREIELSDRGFAAPPDDLGWCGERIALRFGDRIRQLGRDGRPVLDLPGPLMVWNPFACGTGLVASGVQYRSLRLVDATRTVATLEAQPGWSLEWVGLQPGDALVAITESFISSIDGVGLVRGDDPFRISIRSVSDVAHCLELRQVQDLRESCRELAAAWSPDGRFLYLSAGAAMGCWDLGTGDRVWSRIAHEIADVWCQRLALSPDGRELGYQSCSRTWDDSSQGMKAVWGPPRILDARTGRLAADPADIGEGLTWSSDGLRLVGSQGSVQRDDPSVIHPYPGEASMRWPSPDGRWLLAWSEQEGLSFKDSAGAGIHLSIAVPGRHRPDRVRWHPGKPWVALSFPKAPAIALIDPMAGELPGGPAEVVAALDGERWPAALAACVRLGEAVVPLLDRRPRDARGVLAWEALARAGVAVAAERLRTQAADDSLGPVAILAADAFASLTPPAAIPPMELPRQSPAGGLRDF